jgi:hypothetical protein
MDARREYAGFLVVLRTSISTIKMQSTANLGVLSFVVLVIVRYARIAFRDLSAAALRELRRGDGQDWKAAPNRIAPARLRLQVRRLQPDHVGRAGAAGRNDSSPGSVDALVEIDRIQKRDSPRQRGFPPDHAACKASAKLLTKKRLGHVRGLH